MRRRRLGDVGYAGEERALRKCPRLSREDSLGHSPRAAAERWQWMARSLVELLARLREAARPQRRLALVLRGCADERCRPKTRRRPAAALPQRQSISRGRFLPKVLPAWWQEACPRPRFR